MSERLDRIESILMIVAEQTAENSRSIIGTNQTMQTLAQEQVILNQTMQTLAQEQVNLNQTMQVLAQDIAELRVSIAELRDVVEQQNRAIAYLISQD